MPGAPKHPRKRRVRPSYPNRGIALKRRWAENREEMRAMVRAKAGRPPGVADGTTKQQIDSLRPLAEERAERIIEAMAREDEDLDIGDLSETDRLALGVLQAASKADQLVDDEKATARAAMKEAIMMVLMPGNAQTKIQAIRTVLEYTKAKPASTTNTNLNAAEDFLAALAGKEKA